LGRSQQRLNSDCFSLRLRRWGQRAFLPLVFLSLGIWAWVRWQAAPVFFDPRSQLPQHPLIQVYFNHNELSSYQDPYRGHRRPGDNLEQIIIDQIKGAKSQIDVAVQELRSPLIAKALRDRHRAGVRVRVILENTYSRAWSDFAAAEVEALDDRLRSRYEESFRLIDQNRDQSLSPSEIADYDAIKILELANIEFLDDTEDGSKGSGLVHHKFLVVDQQTVIATSANFTLSDLHGDLNVSISQGNANSLVVMHSPELAKVFEFEFELLWGDGPGQAPNSQFGVNKPYRETQRFDLGDAQVWVKFSPDSASIPWDKTTNGLIAEQLEAGQKSVSLALFVFSEQKIANQLAIAHQNGVEVKALIDHSFAYRPYSEGLDMLGAALPQSSNPDESSPCATEVDNQPWTSPIQTVGTPKLAPGDLLHHKFGVIDESVVIMGSHNWSEAANRLNDETLVAIAHPMVAAHYHREFERLYTNARLGLPEKIATQWQEFIRQCSSTRDSTTESDNQESNQNNADSINLNTANQAELEALPGIGEKTAQAIIEARESKPFESLEDLDAIPGIGPKTLEKLGDRVTW
jgi:competence ComEA-like helix-hairpin-helix protein